MADEHEGHDHPVAREFGGAAAGAFLSHQLGPLPLWGWVIGGVGALVIGSYVKAKFGGGSQLTTQGAPTPDTSTMSQPGTDTATAIGSLQSDLAKLATQEQTDVQGLQTSLTATNAKVDSLGASSGSLGSQDSTNVGLWNTAKMLWDKSQQDAQAGLADLARTERDTSEELRVASGLGIPTHGPGAPASELNPSTATPAVGLPFRQVQPTPSN